MAKNTAEAGGLTDAEALAAAQSLATSTTTVVIGCKLPHGIVMELGEKNRPGYKSFVINGRNASRVYGGYGLTSGVPKDFADEWFRLHVNFDMVRNQLIFQEGEERSAIDHARETRGQATGLEPWDPQKAAKERGSKLELDANYEKQKRDNPERRSSVEQLDG